MSDCFVVLVLEIQVAELADAEEAMEEQHEKKEAEKEKEQEEEEEEEEEEVGVKGLVDKEGKYIVVVSSAPSGNGCYYGMEFDDLEMYQRTSDEVFGPFASYEIALSEAIYRRYETATVASKRRTRLCAKSGVKRAPLTTPRRSRTTTKTRLPPSRLRTRSGTKRARQERMPRCLFCGRASARLLQRPRPSTRTRSKRQPRSEHER